MPAQILVVANCKGGTGKTTTAVNVSAELAGLGLSVLVVDLDPQGHAGLGFGVVAETAGATAHSVFRRADADLSAAVRPGNVAGVDVLPADPGFRIHTATDDPDRLKLALGALRDRYDLIVIDTPPSADLPLIAALVAADCVLIPTQLNHLAYRGVQQFTRLCFRVILERNPGLGSFALVPVQIDARINLQRSILARMFTDFGPEHIFRAIRTDISLAESFGHSCPVSQYRPNSRGSVDYRLLVKDIVSYWLGSKFSLPGLAARAAVPVA